MERKELFERLLNEANMTITQIKTLKQTLSKLGDEAYDEENWDAGDAYDNAQFFCSIVLDYLRDKSQSNKERVLLFFTSDDMSANMETDGYESLPNIKDKINLPQFNDFADYVLNTLVPKLKDKPKKLPNFETPKQMIKWCVSRAAKLEGLTFNFEYFKDDKSWAVLLDTEDEDRADDFRTRVDEQLSINAGFNSGEHSYDDVQGLGDIHLGVLQYYEWSEDTYNDLDEDIRDKYVVYCEPAKNYKMRREMDW
ncbi:MAG: hypothetical protein II304_05910 [Bacteroidales bacterium]|nr:hypothetical protein [Bacteroidales bacterium]